MGYEVFTNEESHWLQEVMRDDRVCVGMHTFFEGPIRLGIWGPNDRIEIGRYSWIARDTLIFGGGNHRSRTVSSFDFSKLFDNRYDPVAADKQTVIGSDVWLGHGVTVLAGARIGHGAMIGAEAVVAGDIPPYTIVVGNPGRVVRKRFRDETIERLLMLRWWDWPDETVKDALALLHTDPDEWSEDRFANLIKS
jgi:chloramphenicol O-acetyltransferase type B